MSEQLLEEIITFVNSCESRTHAAHALGVSYSALSNILNEYREIPPHVAAKFGYEKKWVKK